MVDITVKDFAEELKNVQQIRFHEKQEYIDYLHKLQNYNLINADEGKHRYIYMNYILKNIIYKIQDSFFDQGCNMDHFKEFCLNAAAILPYVGNITAGSAIGELHILKLYFSTVIVMIEKVYNMDFPREYYLIKDPELKAFLLAITRNIPIASLLILPLHCINSTFHTKDETD